jgi:hypothetical protein
MRWTQTAVALCRRRAERPSAIAVSQIASYAGQTALRSSISSLLSLSLSYITFAFLLSPLFSAPFLSNTLIMIVRSLHELTNFSISLLKFYFSSHLPVTL